MQELTIRQEQEIVNYLKTHMDTLFIASGSSRAVFSLDDNLVELFSLYGIVLKTHSIIKVPLGVGGYRQSQRETEVYNNLGSNYLAEIYARGSFLTVMESVDVDFDFYDFYDFFGCDVIGQLNEWYETEEAKETDEYKRDFDLYTRAAEAMEALEEVLGSTADNAQVGLAEDGRFVAYDYGFDTDVYASDQMTRTSNYFSYSTEANDCFFEVLNNAIEEALNECKTHLTERDFIVIEDNFIDLMADIDD